MVQTFELAGNTGQSVGNAVIPKEGPKAIPINLDFRAASGQSAYLINLSDFFKVGNGYPGLSVLQGFWIDNSASASPLVMNIASTQQTVIAPAGEQGYYPIFSTSSGQMTVSNAGNCVAQITAYNVPLPSNVWGQSAGGGGDFAFDGSGDLLTSDKTLSANSALKPLFTQSAGGGNTASLLCGNPDFTNDYQPSTNNTFLIGAQAGMYLSITAIDIRLNPYAYMAGRTDPVIGCRLVGSFDGYQEPAVFDIQHHVAGSAPAETVGVSTTFIPLLQQQFATPLKTIAQQSGFKVSSHLAAYGNDNFAVTNGPLYTIQIWGYYSAT